MTYRPDFPISFLKQYHLSDTVPYQSDTFDIIYVVSGQLSVADARTRETTVYRANDILVLYCSHMYTFHPDAGNIFIHLGLNVAFLEQNHVYGDNIVCNSVLEANRNYIHLKNVITNISSLYLDNSADNELMLLSNVFLLLNLLHTYYSVVRTPKRPDLTKYDKRTMQIRHYLRDNFRKPIKLSDLADFMYLSPQYLSRYFKKNFHMNFNQYLNQYRIERAGKDILYTDKKITDIAHQNGFPSIATFNRQFKSHYGVSPKTYKKETPLAPPATVTWLQENKEFEEPVKSASINTQSVCVDVKTFSDSPHNYTKLMNIGFAKKLLSRSMRSQFLSAAKDLQIIYVRMEGLISNALLPRLSESGDYYFEQIDSILDFLLENNFIPFLELGKNSYDYLNPTASQILGRSYHHKGRFLAMLENFLMHCTQKYDNAWLARWHFELWKLPPEPIRTYLDGFRSVYDLIKKYIPNAQVGGPGHITSQPSNLLLDILKSFKSENLLPDFVSIHAFSLQYEIGQPTKLNYETANRNMKIQQNWIISTIHDIFREQRPLYITEFNSSLLPLTYINESCFQAAYIVKNILEMNEQSDMIGYWLFDDLISRNKVPLPSYHAYRLLNQLGSIVIKKADNYCVTKTEEEHYRIIAFHYAHFKNIDSFAKHVNHSVFDVYSYFEDVPSVTLNITLDNVTPGEYHVEKYLLDRNHGSLIDLYMDEMKESMIPEEDFLYKMQTPAPKKLEYLRAHTLPEEKSIYLRATDSLCLSVQLAPHAVCFWDIKIEGRF